MKSVSKFQIQSIPATKLQQKQRLRNSKGNFFTFFCKKKQRKRKLIQILGRNTYLLLSFLDKIRKNHKKKDPEYSESLIQARWLGSYFFDVQTKIPLTGTDAAEREQRELIHYAEPQGRRRMSGGFRGWVTHQGSGLIFLFMLGHKQKK
jgi:hypothetical protein